LTTARPFNKLFLDERAELFRVPVMISKLWFARPVFTSPVSSALSTSAFSLPMTGRGRFRGRDDAVPGCRVVAGQRGLGDARISGVNAERFSLVTPSARTAPALDVQPGFEGCCRK